MKPLLSINDLTVTFQTDDGLIHAADNVSLSIERGQILGLVGESGSGKSVTAMSVLRLIPEPHGNIESGSIIFNDTNLLTLPLERMREIRGAQISMIFQEPMTALSPLHRVGHQLVETLRLHQDISKKEAWRISTEWLEKVGIPAAPERMFSYPYELSGGMRQRVMIAMALMLEPELVIADEPTTALDVTIQAQIMQLMSDMRPPDTSMLLITHDMGVIRETCTHVAVMYAGEIVETGTVLELFENPLHPYTKALIASIPSIAGGTDRLPVIEGQVPSPSHYNTGCRFANRCTQRLEACPTQHPKQTNIYGRHVSCLLYEQ